MGPSSEGGARPGQLLRGRDTEGARPENQAAVALGGEPGRPDRDAHSHADGNSDRNAHGYPYAGRNGDAHSHADGDGRRDANLHPRTHQHACSRRDGHPHRHPYGGRDRDTHRDTYGGSDLRAHSHLDTHSDRNAAFRGLGSRAASSHVDPDASSLLHAI
jgi:hypothetical protein